MVVGGPEKVRYPTLLRSEKPGLHMEPQGTRVRFKMQSIFYIELTKLIITLYSLRYLRRRSTRSGFHTWLSVFFCLTFSQISPIFSSEEAFRFVVLPSQTSTSSKTSTCRSAYLTLHKCTINSFRTFFNGIVVNALKVISAKKLAMLALINSHLSDLTFLAYPTSMLTGSNWLKCQRFH